MEKPMSTEHLPKSDSIDELARFWDTHDLTDFEGELEEVSEPAFERDTTITIHLPSIEAEAVRQAAKAKGIADSELIHLWVVEKIESFGFGQSHQR